MAFFCKLHYMIPIVVVSSANIFGCVETIRVYCFSKPNFFPPKIQQKYFLFLGNHLQLMYKVRILGINF